MLDFCIRWRQPGTRIRIVIVIVVYVAAFQVTPHAAIPLALGGLMSNWLTAGSGRYRVAHLMAGDGAS